MMKKTIICLALAVCGAGLVYAVTQRQASRQTAAGGRCGYEYCVRACDSVAVCPAYDAGYCCDTVRAYDGCCGGRRYARRGCCR